MDPILVAWLVAMCAIVVGCIGGVVHFWRNEERAFRDAQRSLDKRRGIQMMSVKWENGKETRRHWTWFPLAIFALLVFSQSAEACNRCGRSPCRFVQQVVATPVVAATPIVNTYVINNTYPSPLVAGGSTAVVSNGGYQSQTLPLFDPDRYLSARIELKKADALYAAQDSQQLNSLVDRIATLQAPAVERLAAAQQVSAAGQAVSLAIKATNTGAPQSTGYVIKPDGTGGMQVQPLTATQIEQLTVTTTTTQSVTTPQAATAPATKFPMLSQFCAKCHGTELATPKGGFFLGDDDNVAKSMRDRWFDITRSVSKGSMPPADAPQPTQAERAALLNEIESIIVSRGGSK